MFFARPRTPTRLEIWPTFVDALSTVLMAIVFVLMTFLVAQVFLVETINTKDTEVARLQAQLRLFEESLAKAKDSHDKAAAKVTSLEELMASLNAQLAKITQDLEPGIYKLEVSEKNYTKSIEFEIESSKLKVITIKPKLSYNVFLGLFIGIALLIIVVKIIDFKSNTHSTFGLLVVLPLIFLSKKTRSESFEINIKD
jgi:hypothetical protein